MLAALLITSLLGADPNQQQLELLKTFRTEFVELTPGEGKFSATFVMGDSSASEPQQPVAMHRFAIAKYEMPQNLYEAVMGNNPSRWKGSRNSVEMVSYGDSVEFCQKATALLRKASLIDATQVIRLPSEAEWEYACKAGTTTAYSFGDNAAELGDYAWYTGNAAGNDPPVGAKKPNPWGLYDMHGYLWEWTSTAAGNADAKHRIAKGGSWRDSADQLVSHARQALPEAHENPGLGFRCVLSSMEAEIAASTVFE